MSELGGTGSAHRADGTVLAALRLAMGISIQAADEIGTLAPLTIRAHKAGLAARADIDLGDPFEQARLAAWTSADAIEGRAAFLEKRAPRFQGR